MESLRHGYRNSMIQNVVQSIRYKPGSKFSYAGMHYSNHQVLISVTVPNVYNPQMQTKVSMCVMIPDSCKRENQVLELIYTALIKIETHEVQEWMKSNGVHYVHPHPLEPNQF